jgi:uncharacterized repeat protein (TIGR01451 family)
MIGRRGFAALARGAAPALAAVVLCAAMAPARAAFNNATPRGTFAGTHNYLVTGGTLRAQSNNTNACTLLGGGTGGSGTSTASVSGIPAGSTIMAAYLYWGGSGTTGDWVTGFNAGSGLSSTTNISAAVGDRFSELFNEDGYNFSFFGGFYDVTQIVRDNPAGPNGNYTFGGLTVTNSGAYCTNETTLSAWALVVVYSNPSERYRYTRVYDGLQYFRGSSVTTTQSGFRVPDLMDGKVTTITWEGDPDAATSTAIGTYNESLSIDGNTLMNAGCDATNNLYNSTLYSPGAGCVTTNYGADVDTYDITSYLYEGQTSATLNYSSGNDLVLLSTQVISTTNTPVADLAITKTHDSDFTAGQNGSYTIDVQNLGPEIATGTATVTDVLPTGLAFVSGSGTGWTCSAVAQTVTCNNSAASIALNAHLPALTLTVAVGSEAAASTQNTATVSHPMFDGTGGNSTSTDTVTVRRSDLSTSTKTVVDTNGGEVMPGDILRYTITLNETGGQGIAATGARVVDDLPADLDTLSIVSVPAGATDNSVGTGGANGTGQVDVSGITVPAGGSATVVFDATVAGGDPGDDIVNTATITSASGPGATPSRVVTVAPSQAPLTGKGKILYVLNAGTLVRDQSLQGVSAASVTINGSDSATWNLTPAIATNTGTTSTTDMELKLPAQDVGISLVIQPTGSGTSGNCGNDRPVVVRLYNGATQIGQDNDTVVRNGGVQLHNYSLSIPATTVPAGGQLRLVVENDHNDSRRRIAVFQRTTAQGRSTIGVDSDTVINVGDVSAYSAAYPATTQKTAWEPGDVVYLRATVSDPFGDADISSATIALTDGVGSTVGVAGWAAKTETPSDNPAVRIFEGTYTVPTSPAPNYGMFTASVTAKEGLENTVQHTRSMAFTVAPKALAVAKSHAGDFTAGANNSYTLLVGNSGGAIAAGTTTTVKDTLATGLAFVSGNGTGWTCGASGQVVTCTSTAAIAAGASMAPITLTVAVAGNMGASVANQASVGNSSIAGGFQKLGNTDTAIIRHPDLSTSGKAVSDLNGGDANPGDTLRYTITVKESAGYPANGVTVTDVFPSSLTGLSGINASLSTCNGAPSVAGNTLTVAGLSLAGGGTCVLVIDVQVSASAGAGLEIANTATVANPNGPGATPAAPGVTVSQSQVVIAGGKVLYVYAGNTMARIAQTTNAGNTINENTYQEFVLGNIANPLTIAPGSIISADLWLQGSGNTTTTSRTVYAKLFKNGTTQIGGISNSATFTSTTPARQNFSITAPSFGTAGELQPGDTLVLRVYNDSGTGGTPRTVGFSQRVTGGTTADDLSTLTISTPTVVHVDGVDIYSAAYPATTQAGSYGQGDTIYIRATTSDPFGYADISGGSIEIKDPSSATVATATLVNATHTVPALTSGAIRVYEYPYTIPTGPAVGGWTATVTANEGSEGTIARTGTTGFNVGGRVTLRATWGAGANAGDAVSLAITGGTGATAGSSTAPSTSVPATSNAAVGATIALAEAFTSGLAGNYTITLTCEKDSDHSTVTPSGTALGRTITMPSGSVTCTWSNSKTVPLTIVKLATTVSDPVNGTTNPKAIPGAIVEYQIIVTNPGVDPADAGSLVVNDSIPARVDLRVVDIGASGSGPVKFIDGSPSSGLSYTFASLSNATDDVAFSNDNGATWTYAPTPNADGVDPNVTDIRIIPQGAFAPDSGQFTVNLRVRIE